MNFISLVALNGFSWGQTEMDEKYLLVLLLLLSFSWRESKKETNPHLNFNNLMIIWGLCLKCWVGHYSQKVRAINLMECSNATRYLHKLYCYSEYKHRNIIRNKIFFPIQHGNTRCGCQFWRRIWFWEVWVGLCKATLPGYHHQGLCSDGQF